MDFLPALTNGNLIFLEQMGIVELSTLRKIGT